MFGNACRELNEVPKPKLCHTSWPQQWLARTNLPEFPSRDDKSLDILLRDFCLCYPSCVTPLYRRITLARMTRDLLPHRDVPRPPLTHSLPRQRIAGAHSQDLFFCTSGMETGYGQKPRRHQPCEGPISMQHTNSRVTASRAGWVVTPSREALSRRPGLRAYAHCIWPWPQPLRR